MVVEEALIVDGVVDKQAAVTERKKTSLTSPSTWTRRSQSNSTAVERVRCRPSRDPVLANILAVNGILKGYDQLMNLVLDNVKEVTRGRT